MIFPSHSFPSPVDLFACPFEPQQPFHRYTFQWRLLSFCKCSEMFVACFDLGGREPRFWVFTLVLNGGGGVRTERMYDLGGGT